MRERLAQAQGLGESFRGFCRWVLVLFESVLLVTPVEPQFPGLCGLDRICQGAKAVRRDLESSTGAQGSGAFVLESYTFSHKRQSHRSSLCSVSDAEVFAGRLWFLTGTRRGETHPVSFDAFIKGLVGVKRLKGLMEILLLSNKVTAFLPIEMGAARGAHGP